MNIITTYLNDYYLPMIVNAQSNDNDELIMRLKREKEEDIRVAKELLKSCSNQIEDRNNFSVKIELEYEYSRAINIGIKQFCYNIGKRGIVYRISELILDKFPNKSHFIIIENY